MTAIGDATALVFNGLRIGHALDGSNSTLDTYNVWSSGVCAEARIHMIVKPGVRGRGPS